MPASEPTTKADLLAADEARDIAVCGRSLAAIEPARPDFAAAGAHDPTPTPYFVLEELFGQIDLTAHGHLLDVGCGTGRVLAYAASRLPCRAAGVELDPRLAEAASAWSTPFDRLDVIAGSVLDIPLTPYTCFYLFNPFDTAVLERFLDKLEHEVRHPATLIHMSDNGESFAYQGRPGWQRAHVGSIQTYRAPSGRRIDVYAAPQHYSIWRYRHDTPAAVATTRQPRLKPRVSGRRGVSTTFAHGIRRGRGRGHAPCVRVFALPARTVPCISDATSIGRRATASRSS